MILNPNRPLIETLGKVFFMMVGVAVVVVVLTMVANIFNGKPAWEPIPEQPVTTQPIGN